MTKIFIATFSYIHKCPVLQAVTSQCGNYSSTCKKQTFLSAISVKIKKEKSLNAQHDDICINTPVSIIINVTAKEAWNLYWDRFHKKLEST